MRLIAKHSEAGYVVPQQRPSCRNCTFMTGEENGLNQVTYWSCRKHGFEVRTGGICKDHPRALGAPDVASPNRGRAGSGFSMASIAADLGALRDQARRVSAEGLTPNFCQAGVVAPPDSLMHEKTRSDEEAFHEERFFESQLMSGDR